MSSPAEAGLLARFFADLRPGVHVALADSRIVILDVERDRYLRIDRDRSLALANVASDPAITSIAEVLGRKGLTRPPPERLPLGAPSLVASAHALSNLDLSKLPGVIGACLWASSALRQVEFSGLLCAVRRPRRLEDAGLMSHVVRDFLQWRPFFPKDYACMFEALALLRYLAQRGHWATWVFGVRGAPFAAHCWLERDGVVLNDEPDAVAAYARIMAV
ncbi:MAG: lasso peptide biosynthesis B2 protein [Hyphomonadaceae bacterium]